MLNGEGTDDKDINMQMQRNNESTFKLPSNVAQIETNRKRNQ